MLFNPQLFWICRVTQHLETDAAPLGKWEICTVCNAMGRLEGGHLQMQPYAWERQDGQTTLGPQSLQQGLRNWHCQSLKPDSGGIGEGGYRIPNTTCPCLCSPSPCPESQTQRRNVSFQRWAGLYLDGICHLQILLPLHSRCCSHFYTCTHKTNCRPDVREAKGKQRYSFLLCHTSGPPKLTVIDIRNF